VPEHSGEHLSWRFISRAEMWPSQINARLTGAQFVARGWAAAGTVPVVPYFARAVSDQVWGLIVATPEAGEGQVVAVTADDGREFSATLVGDGLLDGEPEAVLAAARYWELPPRFVNELKLALQAGGVTVEDEEPRDDGSLG
jgi:hypothetical protein